MSLAFVTGGSGYVGRNLIRHLRRRGDSVHALVRSADGRKVVEGLGAKAIDGDILDQQALMNGMKGCQVVYHLAANVQAPLIFPCAPSSCPVPVTVRLLAPPHSSTKVALEGPWDIFQRDTIDATELALKAARDCSVPVFVLCSTEGALLGDHNLINADETTPYPVNPAGPYSKAKGIQERMVLAANSPGFRTVSVRPRCIWGGDDTKVGRVFAEAFATGEFKWISGGDYMASTTHIDNTCEGLIKAAERGRGGEAYFVTDSKPIHFRTWLTDYVKFFGADLNQAYSVPRFVAWTVAKLGLSSSVPLTYFGNECTLNDAKARSELGYVGTVTVEEGLRRMKEETAKAQQEKKL